jgi:hypothetical protein
MMLNAIIVMKENWDQHQKERKKKNIRLQTLSLVIST